MMEPCASRTRRFGTRQLGEPVTKDRRSPGVPSVAVRLNRRSLPRLRFAAARAREGQFGPRSQAIG